MNGRTTWAHAILLWALLPTSAWAHPDDPANPDPVDPETHSEPADAERDLPHAPAPLAQYGLGPFEARDPYLLAYLRASPRARSPEVLEHLEVQVRLEGLWSNSYVFQRNRTVIDGETRTLAAGIRLGLFDRFEVGLRLPYQWVGGGVLDSFVEEFHSTFGFPGADRSQRPKDRFLIAGTQSNGQVYRADTDGYGLGDMTTSGRVQLVQGDAELPAITLSLHLRLPTASADFRRSDGIDATWQLDLSKRVGELPVWLYTGASYTYHAQARIDGLRLRRHRGHFHFGLELQPFGPILALVGQLWIETPRETRLWKTSSNPAIADPELETINVVSYAAFGVKSEILPGLVLELGVVQNLADPDITADITGLLNVTWRFGGSGDAPE